MKLVNIWKLIFKKEMITLGEIYQHIFIFEIIAFLLCIYLIFSSGIDGMKDCVKVFVFGFITFHLLTIILGGIFLGLPIFYRWLGTF